tara:strand:- start:2708 stop:3799 length:1092 start_codon:yes stop_codon:yes gene_type:complete
MDRETPSLDFAVIGHQDSWPNIQSLINVMRTSELEELPISKIKGIYDYIPPRGIFKMHVKSPTGLETNGLYIDTFIAPDKLNAQNLRANIQKVKDAVKVAHNLNIKMTILGGFTSLLLEGNFKDFEGYDMVLTTGNSLTSAYVVKGIEKAALQNGMNMSKSNLLVIGATGDIGIACTNYLKGKVNRLLLCARNMRRLEVFGQSLLKEGHDVKYASDLTELAPEADLIISVASSSDIKMNALKQKVIICDAGYPKNLEEKVEHQPGVFLFHGGMGQLKHGYFFNPDYTSQFYRYPAPHLGHGCIIEIILMAFEGITENYSIGKGNITPVKIDLMYQLSLKHGIVLAPFYNSKGIMVPNKKVSAT